MNATHSTTQDASGAAAAGLAAAGAAGVRSKTDVHRLVQYVLAVGYVAFIVFGLVSPLQPRVFWGGGR